MAATKTTPKPIRRGILIGRVENGNTKNSVKVHAANGGVFHREGGRVVVCPVTGRKFWQGGIPAGWSSLG